jgi:DNA-binding SARP family transcriptional activator
MVLPNAPYQVLLLGPPEVRWHDSLFSIPRQTPRTLLFYLASRGNMISRNELLALFWPEETDTIARLRLRETLNKLRKAMPEPGILLTKDDLVGLDFTVTYVDLMEFRALTTQVGRLPWKIPPEEPLPNPLYQKLIRAYQIWRGNNLLAGFEFTSSLRLDAWFSTTANHNETLYRRIAERLSDHEAAVGNWDAALSLARQALVNNELQEDLHMRILRLLIQMGRTKDARQYFHDVQALLQKELNAQPGPELMALYEQIRSNTVPAAQQNKAQWNIHSSMQVPFIGRQQYILALRQAYQKGGGLLILGESGQGKTRLLQEFTSQLSPAPRLLLAQCHPMEVNLPFQPILDLLRQQTLPKEWLALPSAWAEQLQILFPGVKQLRSDLRHIPEVSQEQTRAQLLEGLRQLFLILGKSQRMLLILDDAQWADEATLSALAYLVERSPFKKDALLVVSARKEEENPHLGSLLALAKQSDSISVLQLSQMELNEIDDLIQQVMGFSAEPRYVLKLAQDTGGNPFFILETLHALIKQQIQPDLGSLNSLPLSTSIYNLIHQRVLALSPSARTILEIAAVSGREFSPATLIKASGLSDEEVASVIEELEERLLILRATQNDRDPEYQFVHDKFREAFLLDLSPVRAQLIHRKIALALLSESNKSSSSQAAILAAHFEAAGEWYLAYQQWIKAGQHAHRLYAVAEASQAFMNAENLIDRCLNQLDDTQIYNLYREWGEMAFAANDIPALQAMNTNLMRLGQELNSPLLIGTAFVRLGNACFSSGKLEEGLEFSRLAIQQLEQTDNIYQMISAKTIYGVFLYMSGYAAQAIQVFEEALLLVGDDPNRDNIYQRANLHYEMGLSLILSGNPQRGREHGLLSLKEHGLIHNLDGISTALNQLTLAEYFLGNLSQAFEYNRRGLEDAQQAQSLRMLGYHSCYRAILEFAVGNPDGMLEYAEKAIELGRQIGLKDVVSTAYRVIADTFYMLSDYGKCLEYLQIAYAGSQNSFIGFDVLYRMKAAQFILDQKHDHIQDLLNMIHQAEEKGLLTGIIHAQMSLAMAYQALQKWEEARILAQEIKETAASRGFRSFACGANMLLAQSEWRAGNHSQAFIWLQQSIETAASIPYVWLEIQGRILMHQYLQQDGLPLEVNRSRLEQLLKTIQDHCRHDLFQPALLSYINKIHQILD